MKLAASTTMYSGPPARPLPADISAAIGAALGRLPEVREAHLPQVYAPGKIDPPAQVLVIVLDDGAPSLAPRVEQILREILPSNAHMDVMEWTAKNAALPTVRNSGCALDLKRTSN